MQDFFNITDPNIVKKIINDIESEQNRARREEDWDSYQIDSGNQREYVEAELKRMFPTSFHVMTPSNVNILKKVDDKVSKAYKIPPVRLLDGKINENLDGIYQQGMFDRSLQAMDRTFNRSRCSLVWVQNNALMPTKFKLLPLSQFTFDIVIDNDTLEVMMVILSYPDQDVTVGSRETRADGFNQIIAEQQHDSNVDSKQYALWTKDHHINIVVTKGQETTNIDYMIDPENELMINKLGIIPFVWLTKQPDVPEYPTPNPLPTESVSINVMNSTLLTAATKQIGLFILKYPKGSEINVIHRGFSVALQLPQSTENDPHVATEAEYLVPNSDLAGMRDTFMEYTASILSDNGLEGSTMAGETKSFSSGIERLIASASITDIRSENMQTYSHVEQEIFNIIKKYDEVNGTRLFGSEENLTVIFEDPKAITTEKERLENIKAKDELGLLELKDKFAIAFPNMTENDILLKIERIKEEKKQMVDSFMGEEDDADSKKLQEQGDSEESES